jgi:hypothetical protein
MVEGVPPAPTGEVLPVEQGSEAWGRSHGTDGRESHVCAQGELGTGGKKHQGGAKAAPADGLNHFHAPVFRHLREVIKLFLLRLGSAHPGGLDLPPSHILSAPLTQLSILGEVFGKIRDRRVRVSQENHGFHLPEAPKSL